MTDQSINKRLKTLIRDEFGMVGAPSTYNIGQLPLELLEMIIIKAAVTRRLSSETFGDVFEALAPVCRLWLDLLKTPAVYEKIKQETFRKDPMCRYLKTAQTIRVTGVEKNIFSAVTLRDRLYVVERVKVVNLAEQENVSRIFVYDLDESAVRHVEWSQRIIACTNRQPLVIPGLNARYSIDQLVPCPRTSTLFVLECDLHNFANWAVHKVKSDGTVLLRWKSHLQEIPMTSVSLNLSGVYVIMTGRRGFFSVIIFVYSASTGAFINRRELMATPGFFPGTYSFTSVAYLTATLPDDGREDLVKLSSSKRYRDSSIALDNRMLLMLSGNDLDLVDSRTGRRHLLPIDRLIQRKIMAPNSWYDKVRGLLFSPLRSGLSVLRITC